jgi:hypothetical protein
MDLRFHCPDLSLYSDFKYPLYHFLALIQEMVVSHIFHLHPAWLEYIEGAFSGQG